MASQPNIFGTRSETSYDGQPTQPFRDTAIQDGNPGATDTVTITQNGPGTLQGSSLTAVGPSSYALPTGTPDAVTAALQGLVFQYAPGAPGSTTTTQFILSDASSAGTSATSGDFYDTYVAPPPSDSLALNPVEYADGTYTLSGRVTSYRGADHLLVVEGPPAASSDFEVPIAADGSFSLPVQPGPGGVGVTLYASQPSGSATAQAALSFSGPVSGQPYVAKALTYGATGAPTATTYFRADGSRRVDVEAAGQTLRSASFDTFTNNGQPGSTFVFDPGHGLDVVRQFRLGGADHDTLSFLGSDFGGDVAQVLRNTATVGGSAVITDPATGDTVRLGGVTKAQLAHNRGDIAFHG